MTEEKQVYRIIAQKEGITITAETSCDMTYQEAKETALAHVLTATDKEMKYEPFIALPLTTKERWDQKFINFCPVCGKNFEDDDLEHHAYQDCFNCGVTLEIHVDAPEMDEE